MSKKEKTQGKDIHECSFALDRLLMKDLIWQMDIAVWKLIPKVWKFYDLRLIVDTSKFETEKKRNNELMTNAIGQPCLDKNEQNQKIQKLEEELNDIKEREQGLIDECPDMGFEGTVTQVKYCHAATKISFIIPHENVQQLNRALMQMQNYKLILTNLLNDRDSEESKN